jgi:putative transposase
MARRRRLFVSGASVHVTKRGNNRENVFRSDCDYVRFLELLRIATSLFGVDAHAYSLMTNHVHLLVTPRDRLSLPRAMKWCFGEFTQFVNWRYNRTGTIWDGRYGDGIVDSERYCVTCMRYIDRNPVEAGIVNDPADYPWSSYRCYAFGVKSDWLVPHPLYLALGPTPNIRQAVYRSMCAGCADGARVDLSGV